MRLFSLCDTEDILSIYRDQMLDSEGIQLRGNISKREVKCVQIGKSAHV